jgi:hypothetical protein
MSRGVLRAGLLAALLLLAQVGAVVHALDHVGEEGGAGFSSEHACEWCAGYAHLGFAGAPVDPVRLPSAPGEVRHTESVYEQPSSAVSPPYRGRAPPFLY